LRIGGRVRSIEARGDLLEASRPHQLGEGGVDFAEEGDETSAARQQRLDPAIGRSIRCRVADHHRRLVQDRVIGGDAAVEIATGESENLSRHAGVFSGAEDLDGGLARGADGQFSTRDYRLRSDGMCCHAIDAAANFSPR